MNDLQPDDLDAALGEAFDDAAQPQPDAAPAKSEPTEAEVAEADAEELDKAYARAASGDDDDRKWQRELRKLADAALAGNGVDVEKRHEIGLSRREAVRRLFTAEQRLREDPAGGLAHLAATYAASLDDGGKLAVANQLLRQLGIEAPERIGEVERQRLQHFEAQQAALQQATQQAVRSAADRVAAFAKQAPHFQAVRAVMAGLLQSGAAHDLDSAYRMAVSVSPQVQAAQAAAAQAEAEDRRSKAARAQAARTPRSRSVSVPETEVEEDMDKIMSDTFDRLMGG